MASSLLGTGQSANVFQLASDARHVAKVYHRGTPGAQLVSQLFLELAVLKGLPNSKFVPQFVSARLSAENDVVLEMTHGGQSLSSLFSFDFQNWSLVMAANVLFQLLEALNFIHLHGIVHRDLSSNNVLVKFGNHYNPGTGGNGLGGYPRLDREALQVKLIDFGSACVRGLRLELERTSVQVEIERLAPELFTGPWTTATDVYAFGKVVDEMHESVFDDQQQLLLPLIMGTTQYEQHHRLTLDEVARLPLFYHMAPQRLFADWLEPKMPLNPSDCSRGLADRAAKRKFFKWNNREFRSESRARDFFVRLLSWTWPPTQEQIETAGSLTRFVFPKVGQKLGQYEQRSVLSAVDVDFMLQTASSLLVGYQPKIVNSSK
jgi:serine/threonine protein kinase